jgi:large subunit ribosomal protein L30
LATLQITQRRSTAGTNHRQRETLRSLGLRRIGSAVERTDGPALQGMIRVVAHLVEVNSADEAAPKRAAAKKAPDG